MEDELVGRILACAECHQVVVFCGDCDKRQRYCSKECAKAGRTRSLRLAGARYQRTFKGSQKHAARQAAFESRQKEKLTHQYFPPVDTPAIVESTEQAVTNPAPATVVATPILPHCNSCGRRCDFLVRGWQSSGLRRREIRVQGDQNDSVKGDTRSNLALVPC